MRRTDAACGSYRQALRSVPTPTDLAGLSRFASRVLAQLDRALARIRKLKPPHDEQADVDRWLAQTRVIRGDIVALRDAARRGDRNAVDRAFKKGSPDDTLSNQLAARIGLKVCSKP